MYQAPDEQKQKRRAQYLRRSFESMKPSTGPEIGAASK